MDKSIALAQEFGRRGRVIVPPEELGPKGDLKRLALQRHERRAGSI
jgi:hypothetical protein